MNIFSQIRKIIEQDKIEEAFNLIHNIIPSIKRNDLIIIKNQFSNWEKEYHLGIRRDKEERFRIVYSLLSLLTEIEKDGASGLKSKKLDSILQIEQSLVKGYKKLQTLRQRGELDLLMNWLIENNPLIVQKVLGEEKKHGISSNLPNHLEGINLDLFITQFGLNTNKKGIIDFIIHQTNEIPAFFTAWLKHNDSREEYEKKLLVEISNTKEKYSKLVASGFVGGVVGILSQSLFQNTLNQLLNENNPDTEPLDPPDEGINEDSDDE